MFSSSTWIISSNNFDSTIVVSYNTQLHLVLAFILQQCDQAAPALIEDSYHHEAAIFAIAEVRKAAIISIEQTILLSGLYID